MQRVLVRGDSALKKIPAGRWVVHSIYQHAINLTDHRHRRLILLAPEQSRLVPGAILIPTVEYQKLRKNLQLGQSINFSSLGIALMMANEQWLFEFGDDFNLRLPSGKLSLERCRQYLEEIQNLNFVTGLGLNYQELRKGLSDEAKSVRMLKNQRQVAQGVFQLLGRGRGLTPAGDDLLLGWLMAQHLTNRPLPELVKAIQRRIASPLYTTTVSRNYLDWAVRGMFSSSLIDLAQYLIGESTVEVGTLIANASDYGSTSGIDTLTGLALALE